MCVRREIDGVGVCDEVCVCVLLTLDVPRSDVKRLDVPVEVGLKMILSAGVINPLDDPEEAKKMAAEIQKKELALAKAKARAKKK